MPLQHPGYSDYTPVKQAQVRYIFDVHLRVVQAILAKHQSYTHQEYLYFDLNAGAGVDQQGEPGSPLIFMETATRLGIPFRAYFFEENPKTAQSLRDAIAALNARLGGLSGFWKLSEGDHIQTIATATHELRSLPKAGYGLAYGDPNGANPPIVPMQMLTQIPSLKCLDYLINVGATSYKRARNGRHLSTDLRAIDKKLIFLREPQTQWQWTFAMLTDWANYPDFKKLRFHRIESPLGIEIERRLDLTAEEWLEAAQKPFPFPETEGQPRRKRPRSSPIGPTLNTSDTRNSWQSGSLFSDVPVDAVSGVG